jgi:hypothetical protein
VKKKAEDMKLKEGGEMWLKRRREWSREAGVTHKVWQLTGK